MKKIKDKIVEKYNKLRAAHARRVLGYFANKYGAEVKVEREGEVVLLKIVFTPDFVIKVDIADVVYAIAQKKRLIATTGYTVEVTGKKK